MHRSVATIDNPEFINLQPLDINPGLSKCEIKVFYLGENRNHTSISKESAISMAKTLRGAPIVGYYKEQKEDFADHGKKVIIDDEGIKFECNTVPYGFVAPDAQVWFQTFDDKDDMGNITRREYLMTTGYLWTGQYKECLSTIEEGKPQSMELDDDSLKGEWSKNYNNGMEFFIIDDAIISKLCILGDDVEPCFEGSSITAPKVSNTFTKVDDNFRQTLYTMMQELTYALIGGQSMDGQTQSTSTPSENLKVQDNFNLDNTPENKEGIEEKSSVTDDAATATDFVKEDDKNKDDNKDKEKTSDSSDEPKKGEEDEEKKKKEECACGKDDEDSKKKYELLQNQYQELNNKFSAILEDYQSLKNFKANIEDKEKDEMINRFYMLDEEDKKDVIANKAQYSLADIEAKLSVIYTKKTMAAQSQSKEEPNKNVATTFNLDSVEINNVPDWVKAVQENENK
jgi:hypothetical protein